MNDSNAFDSRTTPAPSKQRPEWLLEIHQQLDDLIYKEQVNQLWKVGMESMMHSMWAKVCAHYTTVSVSCQTDEQVEQMCDTSPGKCATCLHGAVTCPSEEESGVRFGTEEDSEQNGEGNLANRSLEGNFSPRVDEGDGCDASVPVGCSSLVEHGSSPSVVADARQEVRSAPVRRFRSENVKSYQCAHCKAKFSRKNEFLRHQRAHLVSGKRNPQCHLCLRVFQDQKGLVSHTKGSVCQRKPVKSRLECLECAKSFNTKVLFYRHLRYHKEKRCVCTVCNKAFHYPSELNEHMRYHSDERPYRCQVCSRGFNNPKYLDRHVRLYHPT